MGSYQKALDDKPIFTKACTSGVGFAVSDVLTQLFIEKMDFDLKRLVKMASFGFLLHGTTGHFFYNFLDGKLKGTARSPSPRRSRSTRRAGRPSSWSCSSAT